MSPGFDERRPVSPCLGRGTPANIRSAARALTLLAVSLLAHPAVAGPMAAGARGTYRLRGTARMNAGPILPSEIDVRADVILRPGAGERGIVAQVRSMGHVCDLKAQLAGDGTLAFAPGQVCLLELDSPEVAGRVESRLESGGGRVTAGTLELNLAWQLSGSIRPSPWSPLIPVNGTASAAGKGMARQLPRRGSIGRRRHGERRLRREAYLSHDVRARRTAVSRDPPSSAALLLHRSTSREPAATRRRPESGLPLRYGSAVARLADRVPQNVPGDFFVDASCIACDTCRRIAPASSAAARTTPPSWTAAARVGGGAAGAHGAGRLPGGGIGTVEKHAGPRGGGAGLPGAVAEEGGVYHCGYAAESSFGAASWLVVRAGGNVLVDSPRFTVPLLARIREMGGARFLFLTHRDDVADHARWAAALGCERVMHARDVGARTRDVERRIEGESAGRARGRPPRRPRPWPHCRIGRAAVR